MVPGIPNRKARFVLDKQDASRDSQKRDAIELFTASDDEVLPVRFAAILPVTPGRCVRGRFLPANIAGDGAIFSDSPQRAAAYTRIRTQRVGGLPMGVFSQRQLCCAARGGRIHRILDVEAV